MNYHKQEAAHIEVVSLCHAVQYLRRLDGAGQLCELADPEAGEVAVVHTLLAALQHRLLHVLQYQRMQRKSPCLSKGTPPLLIYRTKTCRYFIMSK